MLIYLLFYKQKETIGFTPISGFTGNRYLQQWEI